MSEHVPQQPPQSVRIVLNLDRSEKRIDNVLLQELRTQKQNLDLKNISRVEFKQLFLKGRVLIKGQRARTSSAVAKGTTYIDILGY